LEYLEIFGIGNYILMTLYGLMPMGF